MSNMGSTRGIGALGCVAVLVIGCGARTPMRMGNEEDASSPTDAATVPDAFVAPVDAGTDAHLGYDAGESCFAVALDACPLPVTLPTLACASDAPGPITCERELVVSFVPTAHAQIAISARACDARFATILLTEATAYRGLGNRPGALQMNSGYHWPAGRRENVLPGWARARLESGASAFARVIFQARGEGDLAPPVAHADTPEAYYCLSFNPRDAARDGLDAVSCASALAYDKGRYATCDDVAAGLSEPFEPSPGGGIRRALPVWSAYPPRADLSSVADDHPDVAHYASDARLAFPELDVVSTPTPAANAPFERTWRIPSDWPAGSMLLSVEVNTEGDYDLVYDAASLPTPTTPAGDWDHYATTYGYPYRGQPSVVFDVPIDVPSRFTPSPTASFAAAQPTRIGALDGSLCTRAVQGMIDDPRGHAGSGMDRLHLGADGERVHVLVRQVNCR